MSLLGGFDNNRFGTKKDAADIKRPGAKGHQKVDYKEMLEKRIEEYKQQMMTEAMAVSSVSLPGTDPNQKMELSEAAQAALAQMAAKKAKQSLKKERAKIQIRARAINGYSGGGFLDGNGKVYSASNQLVATIDAKTGIIRNRSGNKVGKYDPNSSYSLFKLEQLIERENIRGNGLFG